MPSFRSPRLTRPSIVHIVQLCLDRSGPLAQAIGERACRQGHSACYTSAHQMLSQLRAARADQTLERKMLRYTAPDLLVVGDLGLRPLEGDEPIDLYEVIRRRTPPGAASLTLRRMQRRPTCSAQHANRLYGAAQRRISSTTL